MDEHFFERRLLELDLVDRQFFLCEEIAQRVKHAFFFADGYMDVGLVRNDIFYEREFSQILKHGIRREIKAHFDDRCLHDARLELVAASVDDDAAFVHDHDTVADLLRFFHIVRRIDDCHALFVEALREFTHRDAALRVEASRRLVHEKDFRIRDDARSKRETLLHAARENTCDTIFMLEERDMFEQILAALFYLRARHTIEPTDVLEILVRSEFREKRECLWDDANGAADFISFRRQIVPCDDRGTVRRFDERREHADRRRLSCAIRPEESEYFALAHREIHLIDSSIITETFRQSLDLDDVFCYIDHVIHDYCFAEGDAIVRHAFCAIVAHKSFFPETSVTKNSSVSMSWSARR